MSLKKSAEIEAVIINLLANTPEINLADVAVAARLSKSDESDRKAIRRVLNSLISRGILVAAGAARARIYRQLKSTPAQEQGAFEGIPISSNSKQLLTYLSKPARSREITSYNMQYLLSYEPNRTTFLTHAQRAELLAMGKVEDIVHPAGTYARNIFNRLLIDLSWNSSRLEGNTYSLLETKRLIELGQSAADKNATETQMIINHKNAIEYMVDSVEEPLISSIQIRSLHALLSENLLGDPSACGELRKIGVGISGSTYQPLENPHLIKECFNRFIEKINLIKDPFEQSLFAIVHLSYLQAFEDVNKRTARLTANIPLIRNNLKPLSFIDVSQSSYITALLGVYEKNDVSLLVDLYIWAYRRSTQRYSATQQALGQPDLLSLKYRAVIHDIIKSIILENVKSSIIVESIRKKINELDLSTTEADKLLQIIETEITSLHEGNIARFKIRPSEYNTWKKSRD